MNGGGLELSDRATLVRQLGLFDASMIMVGIVIGSGIFLTTGVMASSIPSAPLILLVWIVGGLFTVAGALTYAELGAAMPEAGGQYVYLREAFGDLSGFLFGWLLFLVYQCGGIAALAVAFAEYFGSFVPALSTGVTVLSLDIPLGVASVHYSLSAGQLVGVAVIVLLSIVNYLRVSLGARLQNLLTVVKIGTLLAFIGLGLLLGRRAEVDLAINPTGAATGALFTGFGLALVAVFWAFDGWNNVTFIAGEMKNPGRNLPRALILGAVGITVLYVLVNVVYLLALPISEIVGVVTIAEKATAALFGASAATLITIAVLVSIFGAINCSVIAGPRVFYAMARDGLFFRRVAEVDPRTRTPGFAILVQAIWSSVITISGTFDQILTFAMFIAIAFWIAAAVAVFVLRRKRPDLDRPYKVWGYPVVPMVFIVASAGVMLNTLIERPVESLAGLALTAIGVPVYLFWKRRSR
jgi:APA family basic amino acid/polyamine antiporter